MNVVIGLLIGVILLFLVKPVEADNLTINDMLPLVVFGSLKVMPPLGFIPQKIESKFNQTNSQGKVKLEEVFEQSDTNITVTAAGLKPNTQYVSLYYKNSDCILEEDSFDNIIQGAFITDSAGNGKAADRVKDDINKIRSVGIHKSAGFEIVSCASI